MIQPKDVTIIIPHFGADKQQCNALKECITSLQETAPHINRVVVKNGPACSCDRDIRIIPQGQCKAVNAGVAITNTPWIFITNDDMVYPPGWFDALVFDIYDEKCISPKLVEPRTGAPTFLEYFCGGAGGDFDKRKFYQFASEYHGRGIRTGFNFPLLISRELWDIVGGYDINYDPWGSNSDSDLEYKIKLTGVQPVQNESCIVYHFSQTSGTFEPKNSDAWGRNWQYFIDKWGFPRTDDGIWEASFEVPGLTKGRHFLPRWENYYVE